MLYTLHVKERPLRSNLFNTTVNQVLDDGQNIVSETTIKGVPEVVLFEACNWSGSNKLY
jgi:hypothetical protein